MWVRPPSLPLIPSAFSLCSGKRKNSYLCSMLLKTTVSSYTGNIFKKTGEHVINTDRVIRFTDKDGVSSNILYVDNLKDRRRRPMSAVIQSTVTVIENTFDSALSSNVMELDIFPGDNITASTIKKYIGYSDFIHASQYPKNTNYSIVTFMKGFTITKVIVDSDLDSLISAATPGGGASPYTIQSASYTNGADKIYIKFGTGPTLPDWVYIDNTSIPANGDFSVSGLDAGATTITNVSIVQQESYSELQLTLSNSTNPGGGETILISYTRGVNPLKDQLGLLINGWTDFVCS